MSAPRRRGRLEEEHEEHVDERWMASYMDMVTVLMCMFIVLFAMSSVDADKFEQLRNSLATGFGQTDVGSVDTAEGVVVPAAQVDDEGEAVEPAVSEIELAKAEVARLAALREQMRSNLQAQNLEHTVEFELDERGLTIRLVGSETFFADNSVDLTGVAPAVLDAVAPVIAPTSYEVSVEGHADNRPPGAPFASNWELSSGRATQVVRRLVEVGGLNDQHIGAVGFSSTRPIANGTTEADLAANRRVDIVVISDQPESVRALIPKVLDEYLTAPGEALPAEVAGR